MPVDEASTIEVTMDQGHHSVVALLIDVMRWGDETRDAGVIRIIGSGVPCGETDGWMRMVGKRVRVTIEVLE